MGPADTLVSCLPGLSPSLPQPAWGDTGHRAGSHRLLPKREFILLQDDSREEEEEESGKEEVGRQPGMYPAITTLQALPDTVRRASATLAVPVPLTSAEKTPCRPSQAAGGGGDHRQVGTRALVRPPTQWCAPTKSATHRRAGQGTSRWWGTYVPPRASTPCRLLPATAYRVCAQRPMARGWAGAGRASPSPPGQEAQSCHSGAGLRWRPAASQYSAAGHGLCRRGPDATHPTLPHTQLLAYRNPAFVPVPAAPLWQAGVHWASTTSVEKAVPGSGKTRLPISFLRACAPWAHPWHWSSWDPQPGTSAFLLASSLCSEVMGRLADTLCPSASSHCCPVGGDIFKSFQ